MTEGAVHRWLPSESGVMRQESRATRRRHDSQRGHEAHGVSQISHRPPPCRILRRTRHGRMWTWWDCLVRWVGLWCPLQPSSVASSRMRLGLNGVHRNSGQTGYSCCYLKPLLPSSPSLSISVTSLTPSSVRSALGPLAVFLSPAPVSYARTVATSVPYGVGTLAN